MAKGVFRKFDLFWEEDRGLSILLLFLVLLILTGPLGRQGILGETFLSALLTLTLCSGVLAVSRRRWAGIATGGVVAVAIGTEWAGRWSPSPALEAAAALSAFASVAILAAVVFRQVLREGPITVHRVVGSAAAYLLLGFGWGEMYYLVSILSPGALVSSAGLTLDRNDLYYFSLVTLTTLGYGDITPLHAFARSLATLEALTGQLFPAILIARLVSMELIARTPKS